MHTAGVGNNSRVSQRLSRTDTVLLYIHEAANDITMNTIIHLSRSQSRSEDGFDIHGRAETLLWIGFTIPCLAWERLRLYGKSSSDSAIRYCCTLLVAQSCASITWRTI